MRKDRRRAETPIRWVTKRFRFSWMTDLQTDWWSRRLRIGHCWLFWSWRWQTHWVSRTSFGRFDHQEGSHFSHERDNSGRLLRHWILMGRTCELSEYLKCEITKRGQERVHDLTHCCQETDTSDACIESFESKETCPILRVQTEAKRRVMNTSAIRSFYISLAR